METTGQPNGRWRLLAGQFVRFAIVGASGVVVNMLVAFIMNKANGGAQNARNPVQTHPVSLPIAVFSTVWSGLAPARWRRS